MEKAAPTNKQIFITNLPYDYTKDELDTLFSEIGPIKRSFIVNKASDKTKSSGDAFLWFALDGHAEKAVLEKTGASINGRKIQVLIAKPKVIDRSKQPIKNNKSTNTTTTTTSTTTTTTPSTTPINNELIIKKEKEEKERLEKELIIKKEKEEKKKADKLKLEQLKKEQRIKEREESLKIRQEKEKEKEDKRKQSRDTEIVIVIKNFINEKDKIVELLGVHKNTIAVTFVIPFSNNSIRLIARDEKSAQFILSALAKTKFKNQPIIHQRETEHLKRSELVIRNLHSSTTIEKLEETFSPFGEILLAKLPTRAGDQPQQQLCKGFGFIMFAKRSCAEKAHAELNGTEINGRPIAIDWSVPQAEYKQALSDRAKEDIEMQDQQDELDNGQKTVDFDSDDEKDITNFGDDEYQEVGDVKMNIKGLPNLNDSDDEEDQENQQDDSEAEEEFDDDEDDQDESSEEEIDSDEEKKLQKDKEKEDKENEKKRNISEIKQGKTLFIRNMSFDTTEEQLKEAFQEFGAINFIKLVMDNASGKTTGKAFIKFAKKSAACKALEAARITSVYDTGKDKNYGSRDRRKKEAIDMASLLQSGIMVNGRNLIVDEAVDHDKASQLKDRRTPKFDKKNRQLLDIGRVLAESEQGKDFIDRDWKMRELADQENTHKFKINPNYFVSPTRICVRNLPIEIGDKQLMRAVRTVLPEGTTSKQILHAKIAVNKDRVNSLGRPRSLGFGFIEFADHAIALKALHGLNSTTDKFGKHDPNHRLFVQFSIEDARTVKKKTEYLEKMKRSNEINKRKTKKLMKEQREKDIAEGKEVEKPLSRGQKQRQQRRQQRESGAYDAVEQEKLNREMRDLIRQKREAEKENREPTVPQHIQEKIRKEKKDSKQVNVKQQKQQQKESFDKHAQSYKRTLEDDPYKDFSSQDQPLKRESKKKRWFA